MKRGARTTPKLGLLAAAFSLALLTAICLATPLHSEPGDQAATKNTNSHEPAAVERPVAVAKGFREAGPPNIRPEPAISPELRDIARKEVEQQRAARRKLARQELKQQKAEQRKLQQQRAAKLRAEQLKVEQREAAQQEAEQREAEQREAAQREAAQREAAQREAEQREAEQREAEQREAERRRLEKQRAELRESRAQREKAGAPPAGPTALPQPAGEVRAPGGRTARAGSRSQEAPSAPQGGKMALSINSIGLRNSAIETTEEQSALDQGLIHLPQTSRPWERGNSRNVYVVGHRVGWPNTGSWKIFYRLDELTQNDELTLTAGGETYRYKVTEKFVVTPWDVWVTDPVKGRDLLTLQTCTGPDFSQRLIIRADRV